MKKNLLLQTATIGFVFTVVLGSCTKPGIKTPVTLDKAAGKWSINAIRYNIYAGTPTSKDSTVPWRPNPENFVTFDGVSALQYAYNNPSRISGVYSFIGQDSIIINMNGEAARWKILLLTPTNFNIERTSDNLHDFPGATVVTYQSFVR